MEKIKNAEKTIAKLAADFQALSFNVRPIVLAEEAAKAATAHECRIQGWPQGTTHQEQVDYMKAYVKATLPEIQVSYIRYTPQAAVLSFVDAPTEATFAKAFIEDKEKTQYKDTLLYCVVVAIFTNENDDDLQVQDGVATLGEDNKFKLLNRDHELTVLEFFV